MRVFVTGSSGFIGTHLVRTLAAAGHHVIALDVNPPSVPLPIDSEFLQVDLLEAAALAAAVRESSPDALVHLAARTDVEETRRLEWYAANIEGVSNLLDAVRATPSITRAIYTSTQLVCRLGYTPRDPEDYCPNTLYGQSKVETERRVRAAAGGGVATWCLVRPTTIWGPGMNPKYLSFFRLIASGRYLHIGRAPLRKSYGYIGNTVHQYLRLLEVPRDAIHERLFYLADYEPLSIRQWAESLRERMNAPPIRTLPIALATAGAVVGSTLWTLGFRRVPLTVYRLRNMETEYLYDLSDTERALGPLPCEFNAAVDETVAWLRGLDIVARG